MMCPRTLAGCSVLHHAMSRETRPVQRVNVDVCSIVMMSYIQRPEFDNMDSCKMAYEAADRDGGGIGKKEVRLFLQYQIFYDDAWEIFADMDTNADGALSEQEFMSNLDLLGVKISNPKMVYAAMDAGGKSTLSNQ